MFDLKKKILGILRDLGIFLVCTAHVIGLVGVYDIIHERHIKHDYLPLRELAEVIIHAEGFPQSAFTALFSGVLLLLCILFSKQRLTTLKKILRFELISFVLLVIAGWFTMMYL